MSYILDALRRADAERERGAVPGLHSQPLGGGPAPAAAPRGPGRWWAAAAVLALLLLGGWLLAQRPPTAVTVAKVQEPAPPPALPSAPASPAPAPLASPGVLPATAPVASVAAPALVRPPPALPATPPGPPAAAPGVAAQRPASAPAPATPDSRVIPFAQLPEETRRQLPALAIGGAIFSDNAASRMLIVGGQLLHEGDAVAPGVTLEQIKPKSAVLRWKDTRYEVGL